MCKILSTNKDSARNRVLRQRKSQDPITGTGFKKQISVYTNSYNKQRILKDPKFRLVKKFRSQIGNAIRIANSGIRNPVKFTQLVGCTPTQFKVHLKKQFKPGMEWSNYGRKGWIVEMMLPIGELSRMPQADLKVFLKFWNCVPCWVVDPNVVR